MREAERCVYTYNYKYLLHKTKKYIAATVYNNWALLQHVSRLAGRIPCSTKESGFIKLCGKCVLCGRPTSYYCMCGVCPRGVRLGGHMNSAGAVKWICMQPRISDGVLACLCHHLDLPVEDLVTLEE